MAASAATAPEPGAAVQPTTNGHATSESNGPETNGTQSEGVKADGEGEEAQPQPDPLFQLTVKLPHEPGQVEITVSPQEQMQDVRQAITEFPHAYQYSNYHLEHKGKRVNDFVELTEVSDIVEEPVMTLVEDPYTEATARLHVARIRELVGALGDRVDLMTGIDAGLSLCDGIEHTSVEGQGDDATPLTGLDLDGTGRSSTLMAHARAPAPKTIKSMALAAWNPPPYNLRMRGHLLYLQITTNEGEQHFITSHITGFYVNKSTNNKFDPTPRTTPKPSAAHSLLVLLGQISPSFDESFRKLLEYNGERDLLSSYQLSSAIPSAPWMVSAASAHQHSSDPTRTQDPYLMAGADNADTLRDWNEELQSAREMKKESVHDRVYRERLVNKLFAEYNETAVRGAVLVARGEVPPLNPTEEKDAQIFVYNNVFYSFGLDGVGTFASDGGDEAARVATGKDVQGVKAVNHLDLEGLFTPGTVIVDYMGRRVVAQSIVPGIFKQREPGEHQIDYGGVEGKEIIASNDVFVQPFSELSKAMRVKRHAVWDKELEKFELEASVETKGLIGTDGRKYVLDLYRITPLDITWLEQHCDRDLPDDERYPHRMTVMRPELVESYRIMKLREYIAKDLEEQRAGREAAAAATAAEEKTEEKPEDKKDVATSEDQKEAGTSEEKKDGEAAEEKKEGDDSTKQAPAQEQVDISGFSFALNPDVYSGQKPVTDEDKAQYEQDEADVRAVCAYLRSEIMPKLIRDMTEADVGFPMDGQSLTREMHKRGLNVRYLGEVAQLCDSKNEPRASLLKRLTEQEMVARAFKHICNKQLKQLPPCFVPSFVSHFLNCLLGEDFNSKPVAEIDEELKDIYPDLDLVWTQMTPAELKGQIASQVALRFRHKIAGEIVPSGKQLQYLREVCLKLGIQIEAKQYAFVKSQTNGVHEPSTAAAPQTNGQPASSESSKKKKKKHANGSPNREAVSSPSVPPTTFRAENVFNVVPIVKESSPRSVMAEEALDAGRMSIQQGQKSLGQELLLESLNLHEQIYGILHPEVARVYYALSTLYYNLDEKTAAVELAKKAVIVSERTLGIDNHETVLAYLNLSLFEHATGNTKIGLAYIRHAMELWKIVYGPHHPDSITSINNAAVMLQSLKRFRESREWFEACLKLCEEVSGGRTVHTATMLFQLAQAFALDGDTKSGVPRMRESYAIFKEKLGPENQNTKEAESWLETLTSSAVNQLKHANMLASRKLLLRNGRAPRVAVGARPQPPASQTDPAPMVAQTGRPTGIDQRSVDELMKYINGESSKQSTPKKKTTNPKRRQQKAAAT